MTKCIIIGETPENPIIKKSIKFIELVKIDSHGHVEGSTPVGRPNDFKYIELISRNYFLGYDLMFAYIDPEKRHLGAMYVGYWNDGVV